MIVVDDWHGLIKGALTVMLLACFVQVQRSLVVAVCGEHAHMGWVCGRIFLPE